MIDLRKSLKEKRQRALSPEKEAQLRNHLLHFATQSPFKNWGLVWPLPGEPDLRPLCHLLFEKKFRIFLPETVLTPRNLIFRPWSPEIFMQKGAFNTFFPKTAEAGNEKLEAVMVPLLAYDSAGNRLGYGGGFYDYFLAKHPKIFRLGYALSIQYSESLSIQEHDQRLDGICTEKSCILFPPR